MKIIIFITAISLLFFQSCQDISADEVNEYINRMTLEQKIGQLIFMGFQEQTLTRKDITYFKKINPGGIVFYSRNFENVTDVKSLISDIKSIFKNNELPMFFAIDQEGGIANRIEGEFYRPPSEPTIGATNSEELAKEVGLSVGSGLRSLGVNTNLAPVLDLPSDILSSPMTKRSYSNDSKTVEKLGIAYINGLRDAGILATAKHFPGIGRTDKDSHLGLPRVKWKNKNERDLDEMPFKSAVKAGVDFIMVGHFIAEPGDSKNPVSLSSYWMKDVLRKETGFDGLIIVDNIEMKPIKEIMPIHDAAVQSFKAGADIIMISHERKNQQAVFNALMNAVKKGDIPEERLNESLRRIIETKIRMISFKTSGKINNKLKDISRSASENSVTALILKDVPSYKISPYDKVLYTGFNPDLFNAIREAFGHAEILNTTLTNYKKIKPETPMPEFINNFDALIIDADYSDASEIISFCNDLNIKYLLLLTSYQNIQKTLDILQPKWIVIIFENNRMHFKVAAEIITGARQATGRLPYKLKLLSNYKYY